jgi:hypothetical protein
MKISFALVIATTQASTKRSPQVVALFHQRRFLVEFVRIDPLRGIWRAKRGQANVVACK